MVKSMLDQGPVEVMRNGETIATRGRVIWHQGQLYVFRSRDDFDIIASGSPRKKGARFVADADDVEDVQWRPRGCRCSCDICRAKRNDLLATAGQGATP